MKRLLIFLGVLFLSGAIMSAFHEAEELPDVDHVEYLGESIRMVKSAEAVEQFEDYPYVIDPAELERVQKLVSHAPIANEFSSREALIRGLGKLRFPGYGSIQFGEKPQPDGSVLYGSGIAVPPGDQHRILVFRGHDSNYKVLDDFIDFSEPPGITSVVEDSGQLIYKARNGERVVTRPIASK